MKFKEPGGSGEQVPAVGLCGGINRRIRHLQKVCWYRYRYLFSAFNYSRWALPALLSKGHLSRLSALSVTACKLCREGAWPACKMDGELCAELGGGTGTAPAPRALTALGWGTSGSRCAEIPAGDGTQPLASLLRADGSWEAREKMLQPKWLIRALLCCPNLVAGLGRGLRLEFFTGTFFCCLLGVFVSFFFLFVFCFFSSFALEHLLFFTYRSAPLEDFFFFFLQFPYPGCNLLSWECKNQYAKLILPS